MNKAFLIVFERALKKHTPEEPALLKKAEKFITEGYPPREVLETLYKMEQMYIGEADMSLIRSVIKEIEDEY